MPELTRPISPPMYLDRMPTSAADIVAMVADVLYEYLPPGGGRTPEETISRLLEIIESPIAIEIIENELQRRQPRDVDSWH